MLIKSRPQLHGAAVRVSDRTLDALRDHLHLADDSREISGSIKALRS